MNKKIRTSYPKFALIFTGVFFIIGLTSLLLLYFLVKDGFDKTLFLTIIALFLGIDVITFIYALFSNVTYKDGVLYNKFIITIKKVRREEITSIEKVEENYIVYKGDKKICQLNEYDKKTRLILDALDLDCSIFTN